MTQRTDGRAKWGRARRRKSSRSNGGSSGQCVEVLHLDGEFGLADTKLGSSSPIFEIPTPTLLGLIAEIKAGEIK